MRMLLADGHADSLMWNRDLRLPQPRGHLDFPRLRRAGIAIQAFTVVTRGYPLVDGIGLLGRLRHWPEAARRGAWSRCFFQLEAMHGLCEGSAGEAAVVTSEADLQAGLRAGRICAVLGVEGGHALEGEVARVAELRRRGVAFMSLTHLANNELGGCSTPLMGNRPLTTLGREVLDAMAEVRMAVDVAHASVRTFDDALRTGNVRVFCSHTGLRTAHPSWRNLTDAQLRLIADRGGVIGIIFGTVYLGGRQIADVVRHVEHGLRVAGEDAIAFGSDFDGMVPLPRGIRDAADLPRVVEALARKLSARVVEKVAFGNWRRFFGEILGPGSLSTPP